MFSTVLAKAQISSLNLSDMAGVSRLSRWFRTDIIMLLWKVMSGSYSE